MSKLKNIINLHILAKQLKITTKEINNCHKMKNIQECLINLIMEKYKTVDISIQKVFDKILNKQHK